MVLVTSVTVLTHLESAKPRRAFKEPLPLCVEDFANTFGKLRPIAEKGRSRNVAPLRGGLYTVWLQVL